MSRLSLTEEEKRFILERRQRNAKVITYNEAVEATLQFAVKFLGERHVSAQIVGEMINAGRLTLMMKVKP